MATGNQRWRGDAARRLAELLPLADRCAGAASSFSRARIVHARIVSAHIARAQIVLRQLILALLAICYIAGCATTHVVTITTVPPDAQIKIDGIDRGRGPLPESFSFDGPAKAYAITGRREGFRDTTVILNEEVARDPRLTVTLRPLSRRVSIKLDPVPGLISIDGRQVTPEPVSVYQTDLEFSVDEKNIPTTHTLAAERKGFEQATATAAWADREAVYSLHLGPKKKDLLITTTPSGADVYLDQELKGVSRLALPGEEFPSDPSTGEILPRELKVRKAGFPERIIPIGWDDGKSDYNVDLEANTKTVRIITAPPGAAVTINGEEAPKDPSGEISIKTLQFPPVDDKGTLKTYDVIVSKKSAAAEWEPRSFTLAWENGKTTYDVALREIKTRKVPLLTYQAVRGVDEKWSIQPKSIETMSVKDVTESGTRVPPTQVVKPTPGQTIDTLAISPDGSTLLYTILTGGKNADDFHSQLISVKTDGSGGPSTLSDGKTLDLTPSYSPGGDQIVFASNRFGRGLRICAIGTDGAPGVKQLTAGDSLDLWPQLDSDPKTRLYYQSYVDPRPAGPRLNMNQIDTAFRVDLAADGGAQPRISPRNDAVAYAALNDRTGKRDVYRIPDRGGAPVNLTGTPDADDCDPAWNGSGTRLAFASDRGVDSQTGHNYDIWILDLTPGGDGKPLQVTVNGSQDDRPVWDPANPSTLYFRSNRGGEWGIWKVTLPERR